MKNLPFVWCFVVMMRFFLFVLGGEAAAQILPFHSYTVKDGLISNNINTIYQDSRGYMWFGTTDGISVFDGHTFTNYSTHDGLPENFIDDMFEDRTSPGTMWILTGQRICKFTNGGFFTYKLQSSSVGSMYQDREGVVWCGTYHGVIKIKGDEITSFRPDILNPGIGHIAEVDDSLLWFAAEDHRLVSYSRATQTFTSIDIRSYGKGAVWSMLGDHQGNLWVGMGEHYVLRIRGRDVVTSRTFSGSTTWLTHDGNGTLWAGGYEGISSIPIDQFESAPYITYTTMNGLPENTVRSIYVDREQNLWVGGRDRGIAKLSSSRTVKFAIGEPSEFSLSHDLQYAASDNNNHIWVFTENGLQEIWRDQYGRWQQFTHISGQAIQKKWVPWFLYISHSKLWIARIYLNTTPSLYHPECYAITPDSLDGHSHLTVEDVVTPKFPPSEALSFMVGNDGMAWQSFGMTGIVSWDPTQKPAALRIFGEKDGVPTNYVRTLCQDHIGNVWGGSLQDGLVRVSPNATPGSRVKRYTPANGLPDWGIWSIMEDRLGEILVGTSHGGLAIIQGDSIRTISIKEGLPSNTVYCLTEDSSGRLWLGTQIGMVCEDSPGSKRFLKNQAFIGSGVHCCGTTKDGLVWFVTPTDLWIYDYIHDAKDTIPPPAYITGIKVNGNVQAQQSDLQLSHEESNCEIDFIGISFRDERAIRYQYRLLGVDKGWQPVTSLNSVTYASLLPGSYRFEVKAINVDGIESVLPASLTFTIVPPFWQRWWFITMALLIVIATTALIIKVRVHRLLEIERIRSRIATDLHDDIGASLTRISLTSSIAQEELQRISSHDNNETNKLISFLSEIGTSSRDLIDSMSDIVWSVDPKKDSFDDLTLRIKNYLGKTLDIKGIEYDIDIDPELSELRLPLEMKRNLYLIFKEGLNNVVRHSGAAHVTVSLRRVNGTLMMSVEDNGKGFKPEDSRSGNGLKNMQLRGVSLKGVFQLHSTPGAGTRILVKLKLP
ncbi:MAG: hypothetical protein HYR76_14215 [Ignavibacteria bacterium]|nr:hypothetical protein [Ignavibacteria bacterium]